MQGLCAESVQWRNGQLDKAFFLNHDHRVGFCSNDGQGEDQQGGVDVRGSTSRSGASVIRACGAIVIRACGTIVSRTCSGRGHKIRPAANMEAAKAVVSVRRAEPLMSDQVNVDKWSVRAVSKAVDNFWVTVRVAYLCLVTVMRHPDLIVTATGSNFAFFWLIRCLLRSAGALCHEFSWTDQRSGIFVCLVTFPTATIVRVNHEDLILCTFNLTSPCTVGKWVPIHVSDNFILSSEAEKSRVTLMSNPELTVASALTKTVVRITASDGVYRTRCRCSGSCSCSRTGCSCSCGSGCSSGSSSGCRASRVL